MDLRLKRLTNAAFHIAAASLGVMENYRKANELLVLVWRHPAKVSLEVAV